MRFGGVARHYLHSLGTCAVCWIGRPVCQLLHPDSNKFGGLFEPAGALVPHEAYPANSPSFCMSFSWSWPSFFPYLERMLAALWLGQHCGLRLLVQLVSLWFCMGACGLWGHVRGPSCEAQLVDSSRKPFQNGCESCAKRSTLLFCAYTSKRLAPFGLLPASQCAFEVCCMSAAVAVLPACIQVCSVRCAGLLLLCAFLIACGSGIGAARVCEGVCQFEVVGWLSVLNPGGLAF